jgi:hypothetical protein
MSSLAIFCADVGSIKRGNFGWARLALGQSPSGDDDIRKFVETVAGDLNNGKKVALGFECPLFVPVSSVPEDLTKARSGEQNRPWSAGAGAGSLATGLTETQWICDHMRSALRRTVPVFYRWQPFDASTTGMFIWEAFVTKEAKGTTHAKDAENAVKRFRDCLPNPESHNALVSHGRVRSLIGAALLQSGLTSDLGWLGEPCLVIRV